MKIAVAGAGAMGGRFGFMMQRAGFDVTLIDQWQEHVEAVRKDGFYFNFRGEDCVEQFNILYPEEAVAQNLKFDYIILYTKAMQLDRMLTAIKPIISDTTYVVCLLNGIGHERKVEEYVPKEQILLGNTMWTAGLIGPGKVSLPATGTVDLANLTPNSKDAALTLVDIFKKSDLGGQYSENIKYMIYKKATLNGLVNGICTILEANMANYGATADADGITHAIIDEFIAVAAADGVHMEKDELYATAQKAYDPNGIGVHFPSMYQDLIAQNRLTEIDYINGYIANKGKEYGIEAPYCKFVTQLVHCKEVLLGAKPD